MSFQIWLILLVLSSCHQSHGEKLGNVFRPGEESHGREKRFVNAPKGLIPSNYTLNQLPPTPDGEPVVVQVSALIMDVRDIDEMHEHISMELKLKIFWMDKRLRNESKKSFETDTNYTVLNPLILDDIWHPDIFIEHVKSIDVPAILSKPASLRLYPDGMLRYSCRTTVSVVCPMNFVYYPADTQICHVDMQSYGFQSHLITLMWDPANKAALLDTARLSNFELDIGPPMDFEMESKSGGFFLGIRFSLILRRNLSYHLLQTYLPSVLYMLVSWMSFILPLNSASERMGYCMTCLFTLTSMFGAVRQSTPNVSYIKAIDIWMVTCIFFVFLTLLQHAVISKIRRKKIRNQETLSAANKDAVSQMVQSSIQKLGEEQEETSFSKETVRNEYQNPIEWSGVCRRRNSGDKSSAINTSSTETILSSNNDLDKSAESQTIYQKITKKVNKYMAFAIPVLFVLFNIIYWSYLIHNKMKSYDLEFSS